MTYWKEFILVLFKYVFVIEALVFWCYKQGKFDCGKLRFVREIL